jgi:hypothetical protein
MLIVSSWLYLVGFVMPLNLTLKQMLALETPD